MKLNIVLASLAMVAFSGCAQNATVSESTDPAPAESEVVGNPIDQIIGKRLVADNGIVFIVGEDGTMGGEMNGEEIVGAYTRDGNEVCSTYTAPKNLVGREFCSTPVIKNGTVVFNRRDGSKSLVYKITE